MCRQEKINTQKMVLTRRFYRLGYAISQITEVVNGEVKRCFGNIKTAQDMVDTQIIEELLWG
jgi:hypothetical protein